MTTDFAKFKKSLGLSPGKSKIKKISAESIRSSSAKKSKKMKIIKSSKSVETGNDQDIEKKSTEKAKSLDMDKVKVKKHSVDRRKRIRASISPLKVNEDYMGNLNTKRLKRA